MKNSPHNIPKSRVTRGGTLIPAIALALGSLSAVSGANPALAADSVGGVRDKSGVVEKSDQQTSDLPAGSCVINSGKPSGSQAGFSWNTLEPSETSDDKTLWGLSVSFDNSKDRTFADWYFSNSGSLSAVLNTGTVPSMEAGTDFPAKPPLPVTAKADESIDITASGRSLRNLNLYAELTDEKVKQFASATADDPVRYAWQSNYKKYDPNEPKATEGDNAIFGATVNPWPNENIECNPITVSWENWEKHVIVPGDETKVGTINVPALQNGGTDDSMSRMIVEAYDGNGKFIGTTDPEASGGTKNLRIDETTGDIYFTWPEYRGTDLATDKNVNFSVLAQPRSVNELQAATEHNNDGIGAAFEASNSLNRYSKTNVVDSGGVTLDNTNLHNPKYDENEKHITSEIGEDAGEGRHIVTFTPVADSDGNTLQDLIDKFNATVELDEEASNIYDGWDVKLNEDYTVTVKSPGGKDTRPGTFAQPIIKVTYSNGSTDLIPLLVIVDPNNTQTTDVNYPKTNSGGEAGQPMTTSATSKRILGKGTPVKPATFSIENAPSDWNVTIDEKGVITAIPPTDAKPGNFANVEVEVTYPDGTIDTPSTTFVVGERKNKDDANPAFPEKTVYPGENTTSTLTVEKPDDVGFAEENPFIIAPQDESFTATEETNEFGNPIYKVTTENGDWFVSLDNNGDVLSEIPDTAQPGDQVNVPVKVTYADGSYDMANAPIGVVDNARQVPFETVYVFDPEIPAGQYEVKEKGVPGREVLLRDETWSRVEDPSNEVVHIGTKPAESAENVSWVVPIPFPTEVRENPDLKPGETRVVQEGENGEKIYTAQFTAKGDEASVAEQETTKDPQPRIIEVGPGIEDQELTSTKTQEVPFDIEYIYDDTLESGEQIIEEEGVPGEEIITSTQKIVDGKPSGEPSITIEQTKDPKNAKIRVGTKTTGESTETIESEIPFDVKVEFDPEIPAGTSETVIEGKPGKKIVTVNRDIVNSTPGESNITEEIVEEPVDQIIKVGTKPSEASEKVSWTAQVPFEVETRPNPELKPGEVKVVQKGEPGEKTYSADFTAEGDQATVTPEEKQTKDPVKEIIEYGPEAEDTTVVTKTEKPVPFETEIIFDSTLEEGKQIIDQQGELGTEVVTSTQKIINGNPSGDPTVTTNQTKTPKNAKIRVGTKTTGETAKMIETEVPFDVKVEFDPNMPAGTSETVTEGKPGKKAITVTQKLTNSQPDGESVVEEKITEQPVDQVIKVGTKPSESSETVKWTAQIPFEVETRPNPDLRPGEVKTIQKGVPGEKTYTADFTAEGSKTTVTPEEKQTKEPVKEIIEYGPAADDASVVTKVEKPVPFVTEIVFDDTLEKGKQVVDQQGQIGAEIVTSTQKIVDGKLSGDPDVVTERTKEPVKQIIRVGTFDPAPSVDMQQVSLPFGTKIIYDESLEPGQESVDQEGENGAVEVSVEDGQPSVKMVKEPVQRVVRVGTRPADGVEWSEEVPFGVQVVEDPDIEAGEYEVVQQGKPGEVVHKTDGTTVTRVEKVDHVIKVGTKSEGDHVSSYEKDVPFETEIVFDESLDAGVQETVQEGTFGKDKVTATLVIKNSKVVDTRVDTERVSDPVKKIVKVGTKGTSASTTIEWVEETPFGVDVRVNPELQPGETRVVQEGASGEVKHVVAVEIDDRGNVVKDDPVVSVVKEPVDQVIEVGPAKDYESVLSDKHTEKTPYETLIEYDPSLPVGKVIEDQAGVFGVVEVTKTWNLVNGVPVGEADESSRVVDESKPRKLRVGSMCDCVSSEVPESSEPAPVTSDEETPATSEPAPVTSEEETPATSEPAPVTSEDEDPVTSEPAPVTSDEETPATSEPAPVTSEEEIRNNETTPTAPGRNTEKKLTTVQPTGQAPQNTVVPETETETTETTSTTDNEQNDNVTKARNSALASTGANVVMILTIAGLIILAGLGVMMMRRRDKDS